MNAIYRENQLAVPKKVPSATTWRLFKFWMKDWAQRIFLKRPRLVVYLANRTWARESYQIGTGKYGYERRYWIAHWCPNCDRSHYRPWDPHTGFPEHFFCEMRARRRRQLNSLGIAPAVPPWA